MSTESEKSEVSRAFGTRSVANFGSAEKMKHVERIHPIYRVKLVPKKVSFFDFKGLMAPVFTSFIDEDDVIRCNSTLDVSPIKRYARWLKTHKINGISVNSICGEGPAMTIDERKDNTEHWFQAALENDLMMMLQIGAATLPDVLDMARHAEQLGVHAVTCMPDIFYRPSNVHQLLAYCKIVAKECHQTPFFYYHIPKATNVEVDMVEFCKQAEEHIPNFFGIQWAGSSLNEGARCLKEGRVVILANSTFLTEGLILGFMSAKVIFLNHRPDDAVLIYKSVLKDDFELARSKQNEINKLMLSKCGPEDAVEFVDKAKKFFNKECKHNSLDFDVGPSRYMLE